MRTFAAASIAAALALSVAACAAGPEDAARFSQSQPGSAAARNVADDADAQKATFLAVIDGDTIRTTAGKVRIIGIDTPELDECGYERASAAVAGVLSPGDSVTLQAAPELEDRDAYGRLLRYVITDDGVDVGLMQLQSGHASARYDSTDGYPHHPREAAYHGAQVAGTTDWGAPIVPGCEPPAARSSRAPAPGRSHAEPHRMGQLGHHSGSESDHHPEPDHRGAAGKWWLEYESCAQLKRNTAGHPTGPFSVHDPDEAEIYEWFAHGTGHRGDGDGDGLACE